MSFQNASLGSMLVAPRLTLTTGNPGASVAGINTTTLADGAFVYCVANQGGYQLDRTSTAAPNGTSIIAPDTGPGRWILKLSGAGAAIPPWSLVKIVDSLTAVPLAQQDGSVGAPYSTIQGAITANPGVPLALQLVAYVYAESVVVPAGAPIVLISSLSIVTGITVAPAGILYVVSGALVMGTLDLGANAELVALCAVAISGATLLGDNAKIKSLVSFSQGGVLTLGDSCLVELQGRYDIPSGVVVTAPTNTGSLMAASPYQNDSNFGIQENAVQSVVAPLYSCVFIGANLDDTVVQCQFLSLQGCKASSTDVTADGLFLKDTLVSSGGAWVTTGRVQIVDSDVAAATWNNALAFPFELDSYSNYWIKIHGTVLTNAGAKVITSDVVP